MFAVLLPTLLSLAKEGIALYNAHAAANPGTTPAAAATTNPAIKLALAAVGVYQQTRDQALAAGAVSAADPAVVTDASLIADFEGAAIHFRDHAADLLAKYST